MCKPRCRYNHKTGDLDMLFRVNPNVVIIPGTRKPDGSLVSFELPYDSPLVDLYRNNFNKNK